MSLLAARPLLPTPRQPAKIILLNLLQDTLLELPLNLLALVISARLAVQSHQGTKVELGGLEQLNLSDVDLEIVRPSDSCVTEDNYSTHVLERVDALSGLLNLAANDLGNELGGKLGEGAA